MSEKLLWKGWWGMVINTAALMHTAGVPSKDADNMAHLHLLHLARFPFWMKQGWKKVVPSWFPQPQQSSAGSASLAPQSQANWIYKDICHVLSTLYRIKGYTFFYSLFLHRNPGELLILTTCATLQTEEGSGRIIYTGSWRQWDTKKASNSNCVWTCHGMELFLSA